MAAIDLTVLGAEPAKDGKGGVFQITNADFVAAVFPSLPEGGFAAVCSKSGDPGSGGWLASRADLGANKMATINNNYLSCSSFYPGDDGSFKARKAQFAACHFLMLDDLGTKVPLERLADFELSWLIETSPGNFQGGIILADPLIDGDEAVRLLNAVIASGLCDAGATGPLSRWARLPVAINGKPKYTAEGGAPFQCRLIEWRPDTRYTPEEIVIRLQLKLVPANLASDLIERFGLKTQPAAKKYKFDRENALNGFAQGNRDAGLFGYACSLRGSGLKKEEVRLVVHGAAAKCEPPMSVTDADNCVESAWRYDSSRSEKMTDVGNARRLVSKYGEDIRYVFGFKKWLVWDGGRWLFDEDGEIMRRTKDTVTAIYNEAKNASEAGDKKISEKFEAHAKNSQSLPRIKAAIELAQSEPGIPVSTNELDTDNYILGVANGIINLKTGALREPRREDLITKRAPVAYDLNASAPIFMSFLERIMNGNSAMISFIQRAVGYSLTGATDEQCLFFLHGSGSNGKSTLLNVIKELLGDYALQCPAETLMVKPGGGSIPNDIARLRGARMVATSETEEGRRFAEVMIKQLTGNDTIAARFLFGEYFEFVPNFKIWLAANHKPVIRGDDYAIWRRIRLIPFAVTISPEEKDGKLPEKLKAEYPGILAWAVEGCLEWQRLGLNPPPEVLAATEEYKSEMDLIGKWIEERCITELHTRTTAKALYTSYRSWVEENGGFPLSSTKFGLKLRDRGYTKEKSGIITYHGIGLREHSDSLDSLDSSDSFFRSRPHFDDTETVAKDPEKTSQPSKLSSENYLAASRGE